MLETPRLILAFPTPQQIDGFYNAIVGTDIFDTLIWEGPSKPADLYEYWEAARQNAADTTRNLALAVIERASGAMIGGITLRPVKADAAIIDLGYVFAKPWHGRGYATESVGAMVGHGFAHRAMERCFGNVFVGNTASRRVMEKLGFLYEGTARRATLKRGVWKDEWILAITRPDWEGRWGDKVTE